MEEEKNGGGEAERIVSAKDRNSERNRKIIDEILFHRQYHCFKFIIHFISLIRNLGP